MKEVNLINDHTISPKIGCRKTISIKFVTKFKEKNYIKMFIEF